MPFVLLAGEPGDRVQFSEFIMANSRLYALRHERALTTKAVANFTRSELATALRKVGLLGHGGLPSGQRSLQASAVLTLQSLFDAN